MKKILRKSIALLLLLYPSLGFGQSNAETSMVNNTETKTTKQYKKQTESENKAPWFVRKYEAQLGFFMPFSNTNMSIGNDNGTFGTDIDLENDLGLKPYTFSAFTGFTWHISRRSRLSLNYFYIGRSATHTLDRDITIRDTTFNAYASVSTLFNTHIGRIVYGYAILSKPNYEAGVLIGSHILNCSIRLEANTSIGNLSYDTRTEFTAPLPDIGFFGGWAINDKWAINGEFSYLPVNISSWTINILSYNAAVQYQAIDNLSFSLSYTGLNFKVEKDGDPLNGYLKWGYYGPSINATYRFGRGF